MRYRSKRSYSWTQDIAYSVGLIASDGCLKQDRRHVDLTSVDIEQLLNFSKALGRNFTIGTKKSGSLSLAYRIQFSDVAYYDFLLACGLTPVKSKIIPALKMPDDVYADFLRGLFDGDGCVYGYMDPRWRSSFMFYMSFCSASMVFLIYLQETNTRLFGTGKGSIHGSSRAYSLSYAKKDSRLLHKYMYRGKDSLSLSRKKDKLQAFILRDNSAIISDH